ncbi:MAG: tRNA 5-methoxyuridine(34)/uridine 5-oxyacetic acid(34) synthase CmoB [Mariprofundaceae bacterium]|nr:tRNA 5-methoxyuridine(34)/uridine 5-oxyacetic acid(34) synthase CmoB [Mariprofundaceae bacterium]
MGLKIIKWQQQEQASFKAVLQGSSLEPWKDDFFSLMQQGHAIVQQHGDAWRWQEAWQKQPQCPVEYVEFNHDVVCIGTKKHINTEENDALHSALHALHPWRKGPFSLFGINIDTEWHSDWKWARIAPHITPLMGRTVLDVGCGSGYHLWRMLGAGAKLAVGIDPTVLFAMQFEAIKRYQREAAAFFLPVGIESLLQNTKAFDTVFSMGILYHRHSPMDHLMQLFSLLRGKGELVLETLYIDGDAQQCLLPSGRYANMRNVWFIPSIAMLKTMLHRAGFHGIHVVHAGITSINEQRSTDWMHFKSLENFLADGDPSCTCEGYPAPRRVVLLAKG